MDFSPISTSDAVKPLGINAGKVLADVPLEATPPLTRDASPSRTDTEPSFSDLVWSTHEKLRSLCGGESVKLNGESLDIASLVAVSR